MRADNHSFLRLLFWLALVVLAGLSAVSRAENQKTALVLSIKGAIGPAVSDYVVRGLEKAEKSKAALVIIEMDTPGGFDTSMRDIISHILLSPVPVVSYVYPAGSRAASAGTYILYASQVAAMAPTTNLGAATPIRVGGLPGLPEPEPTPQEPKKEEKATAPKGTLERKMINDAVAYITALADRYGRNAEWAEQAVREAVSLTAEEALAKGVIDVVAANLQDLLKQLDARQVIMEKGTVTLATRDLQVTRLEPDWRTRVLIILTDPNVAYILMLLGIYGLIYELANPGFVLPGVVGAICLLLALYTFHVLPINYTGLALIFLGICFMIAEAFTPSFGVLGIGGVAAFVFGSIILMDEGSMAISMPLIIGTGIGSAGFFFWLMSRLYSVHRKKAITGREQMIGITGEALEDFDGKGRILVLGESWQASCPTPVRKGQKVRVLSQEGLTLQVTLLQEDMS